MPETKAAALVTYIRQLPSFKVRKDLDYDHIGATLIAIILQAGLTWKTTVKPRDYDECRSIINEAADLMDLDRIFLDFSIWSYMSDRESKDATSPCRLRS